MKIDYRKKSQDVVNHYGKRIYIWKEGLTYGIGINGTSSHISGVSRTNLLNRIQSLMYVK